MRGRGEKRGRGGVGEEEIRIGREREMQEEMEEEAEEEIEG